ncbi:carcinoembryonic antigen-related cell adhesion molecule 20 [Pteronotus mesoamericanus]|uniref:carcinoembryonic antigen-related cell adhesion molecule 20 n=1 Tax=Pteronotus mesoamericanus TaxID=1884717 RepID=UPI0023EC87BE|nr:carcinoembryonic antigen-related cell adhesion molecule 20 [Pteronotus parnellii mesoamericanus]
MRPPGSCCAPWAEVLLSASLLTAWSLPAATELTLDARLLNICRKPPAKPTVSVSQGAVMEGKEKVTFQCDTKDINVNISWVSNDHPLVFHERVQLFPGGRELAIFPVLRGDAGSYQCEAWCENWAQSSDLTYLVVNYGPDPFEIKVEPSVHSREVVGVIEGSNVTFSAETQSHPPPAYSWFLPNGSAPSFTTRTFTIHLVSREHEGTYRCFVNNSATQLSHLASLKLQVLKPLTKPLIMTPSLNVTENARTVPLTCQTTHEGAPVQWLLGGKPLLPSKRLVLSADNRTLVMHHLWRNDTEPFECEVWHGGIWTRSDPLRLTIYYGPDCVDITRGPQAGVVSHVEAELNSSLTLQCRAQSQPDAEYHWTLEHSTSVYMGQKLVIEALTWEHQGTYNCTAYNPQTRLARSASVLVRVVGPQSSLSAGSVAGIAVGIVAVVALTVGLGCFLYTRNARWHSRKTAEDPICEVATPTSKEEHLAQPSSNKPKTVYANILELQDQVRVKKMLSQEPPEQFYEKELPSATPGGSSHGLRKPSPTLVLHPSTPPKGNTESVYEVLVNPECSNYCGMKSSV